MPKFILLCRPNKYYSFRQNLSLQFKVTIYNLQNKSQCVSYLYILVLQYNDKFHCFVFTMLTADVNGSMAAPLATETEGKTIILILNFIISCL